MKRAIITGVVAVAFLVTGCGNKNGSSGRSATPPSVPTNTILTSLPILQPALTAMQQGDKSTAVSNFLAVDWGVRPLFVSGSPLSFSESQFHALSDADYHAKSKEATDQLADMKWVATTVFETGRDAALKGDAAQARKCFMSLKQFGTGLESPDYMLIVQLVGKGYEKEADWGMAKIRQ